VSSAFLQYGATPIAPNRSFQTDLNGDCEIGRSWDGRQECVDLGEATGIGLAFPFLPIGGLLPMRVGRGKICDGIHWNKRLAWRAHRLKISISWDYPKEYSHIHLESIKYQRLGSRVCQSLLSASCNPVKQ
jgi:hypothetical protein